MAASLTEALGSRETKVPATRPAHLLGAGPGLCSLSFSLHDDRGTRQAPEGSHREARGGRQGDGTRGQQGRLAGQQRRLRVHGHDFQVRRSASPSQVQPSEDRGSANGPPGACKEAMTMAGPGTTCRDPVGDERGRKGRGTSGIRERTNRLVPKLPGDGGRGPRRARLAERR